MWLVVQTELEGTHRVRTHAALLLTLTLTLTFDLSTQNPTTSTTSIGYPKQWRRKQFESGGRAGRNFLMCTPTFQEATEK